MKSKLLRCATAVLLAGSLTAVEAQNPQPPAPANPMMGMGAGQMPMNRGQMPMHRRQMTGCGQGQRMGCGHMGMMNPQMKQQMMAMRQQHMHRMEERLANIEALLKELVEMQKKRP